LPFPICGDPTAPVGTITPLDDPAPANTPPAGGTGDYGKFKAAIVGQESGGRYGVPIPKAPARWGSGRSCRPRRVSSLDGSECHIAPNCWRDRSHRPRLPEQDHRRRGAGSMASRGRRSGQGGDVLFRRLKPLEVGAENPSLRFRHPSRIGRLMPRGRDQAGNIWELDAQGKPVSARSARADLVSGVDSRCVRSAQPGEGRRATA
jgi:hypothetical protein